MLLSELLVLIHYGVFTMKGLSYFEHFILVWLLSNWISIHDCILINKYLSFFGGGGPGEEEERVVKGDEVIVDLDATLEDLYMGGTLKVLNMRHGNIYIYIYRPLY